MDLPKIGGVYKHFKGDFYKVLMMAKHSETQEQMVVYQAMYGFGEVYVRPLEMFMSPVDKEKYPDASQTNRFELQETAVDPQVMDFLDASSNEERLSILSKLHPRITDDMINVMAISLDVEIKDGPIETRYEELKYCILTRAKYESNRHRD